MPGTVEAEDYDLGGSGIAYSDTTAGNAGAVYRSDNVDIWTGGGIYLVGTTAAGEWLEYTVDVATAGSYTLDLRVANGSTNSRQVRVLMDGVDITGPMVVTSTGGWNTWTTISKTVNLNAGQQVMRLQIDSGSVNINRVSVTP